MTDAQKQKNIAIAAQINDLIKTMEGDPEGHKMAVLFIFNQEDEGDKTHGIIGWNGCEKCVLHGMLYRAASKIPGIIPAMSRALVLYAKEQENIKREADRKAREN